MILFNIIPHLRLGLSNGLFPSDFPTNTVSHSPGHLIPYCITRILFGDKYKSRISSLRSFLRYPVACSIRFLFLEYPQPMFLPRCNRPSFADINNMENATIYSFRLACRQDVSSFELYHLLVGTYFKPLTDHDGSSDKAS